MNGAGTGQDGLYELDPENLETTHYLSGENLNPLAFDQVVSVMGVGSPDSRFCGWLALRTVE